jgi:SAM-dependent methyltransferase
MIDDDLDWSTVSASWDAQRERVETMSAAITEGMLAALALAPGERVLELGAGTGELSRRLAAAVGADGRVVATDVAAGMVALIEATTSDLPNVEPRQADAADTGEPEASYDAVAFRMGLMLMPEPRRGLAEIRRVLRPGGRLAVAVWAAPEHNPWLLSVGMALLFSGAMSGPMPTDPGGPFSLGDPGRLVDLATAAGFTDAEVSEVGASFEADDVAQHVENLAALAPPLAEALAAATVDQREAILTTASGILEPFHTDSGFVLPGRALLLRASR